MRKETGQLAGTAAQRGFTLAEVLVGGLVLVAGLVMISQFFASATARVLESDIRSVLHQVATKEIETIRGLPYGDVGTTDGHPQGTLAADEERVVQNVTLHIHRAVIYWTDPSYSGPYPANYRRVTITVSAVERPGVGPVELVTNVAGGAPGGTVDITVTDVQGNPVKDALITITNDHLVPSVNIHSSAIRTDDQGRLIVPGLVPDPTGNYVVSATKSGYSSDHTDPSVVVVDGLPYTVVQLTIDKLATMVIEVVDGEGNPVEGVSLDVLGPGGFDQTVVSTAWGVNLTDLRYSTNLDPYLVMLTSGQGYEPQTVEVVLEPGTTEYVVITAGEGGGVTTTTTTVASTTTTTSGGETTTTTSTGITTTTAPATASLHVTVYEEGGRSPRRIEGARVTLDGGQSKTTNRDGWVFFSILEPRSYGITVTATNYQSYSGTVVVSGATTLKVYLVPLGSGPPPTR